MKVYRKVQAAIGEYNPAQEMETKMVWSHLKVFWFNKDNPTGHSEKKKEEADRRRGGGGGNIEK